MIVFLLLVIIAVLLMGASAFLGAVGMVLGFVALVLMIFFSGEALTTATGLSLIRLMSYGLLAIAGVLAALVVMLSIFNARLKRRSQVRLEQMRLATEATLRRSKPKPTEAEELAAAKALFDERFPSRPRRSKAERKRSFGR